MSKYAKSLHLNINIWNTAFYCRDILCLSTGGDCYLPQRRIFVGGIQSKVFSGEKGFTMLKCSSIKGIDFSSFFKKMGNMN